MSASNWATCPQCMLYQKQKRDNALAAVKATYGKVDADKYLADLREAEGISEDVETTLREDYELWIDDDFKAHVNYLASCDRCGFKYEHRHKEQLESEAADE